MSKLMKALEKSRAENNEIEENKMAYRTTAPVPVPENGFKFLVMSLNAVFICLIVFVLYGISAVKSGVAANRERMSNIHALIQEQDNKIAVLTARAGKSERLLEARTSEMNRTWEDKIGGLSESTSKSLKKMSIDLQHAQTLIYEFKSRVQSINEQVSQLSNNAKPGE